MLISSTPSIPDASSVTYITKNNNKENIKRKKLVGILPLYVVQWKDLLIDCTDLMAQRFQDTMS